MPNLGFTFVLTRVGFWTLPMGLYSLLALLRDQPPFAYVPAWPVPLDAALSFAMGLLIAFRVNRAYERWWEARQLWGTLVNVSRNLAVKVDQLATPHGADRQRMRDAIVAFCYALKDHLRDEADPARDRLPANNARGTTHVPSHLAARIYQQLAGWERAQQISGDDLIVLDREARLLLDVCGACERIKNTMMSVSWRSFTRQIIGLYLLIIPWGLVDDFGAWMVPLSMVVAYFVIGGEAIAQYVEEPFGDHEDHLDLDNICANIDESVSQILLLDSEC